MTAAAALRMPVAEPDSEPEGAVRVGRNFVYRIASQAGSAVINVAAMVLLGRALGAEGYGNYTFFYALIPLISNLAGAGIGIVVTREIARDPACAPRILGDAILVRWVLGALVFVGVAIVSLQMYDPAQALLVLIVTSAALLDFSQDVSIWVLRARERLDLEARLLLLSQVVWLALIGAAVVLDAGLPALLAAATVAFAVRALVGAWMIHRRFDRAEFAPDRRRILTLLKEGLPFGLALFGVVLYGRIGLLTLKSLGTALDVSYFQVAYLLSQPFTFIATALAMAMFPGMARRAQDSTKDLRGSLRRTLKCQFLMGLPLTLALVLLAEPLIHLLFHGHGFDQAATALRIMSLGITVIFLNHAARYALAALDRQRDYLIAVGFGIVVNGVACALLVPRLGFAGACLAFLAAEGAIWLVCLRALMRHVSVFEVARDALRPLAAASMAALWILALHSAPAPLVALAAAITYLLTLWWTHALTDGEMRVLRHVFQSFVGPRAPAPRAAGRLP
jgi:O-antigen/teichoic acid export membrane protein